MISENHAFITRTAFRMSGERDFNHDAVELVVKANNQSDTYSFKKLTQHYQGKPLRYNSDFYFGALTAAYRLFAKNYISHSLYFLGRALHCLQDFYAHTNWVALRKKNDIYDFGDYNNLKSCTATPTSKFLLRANHRKHHRKKDLKKISHWKGEGIKLAMEAYKEMIDRKIELSHPDMHLDNFDSFASKIIKKAFELEFGNARQGYTIAEEFAVKHTKKAIADFKKALVIPENQKIYGTSGVKADEFSSAMKKFSKPKSLDIIRKDFEKIRDQSWTISSKTIETMK